MNRRLAPLVASLMAAFLVAAPAAGAAAAATPAQPAAPTPTGSPAGSAEAGTPGAPAETPVPGQSAAADAGGIPFSLAESQALAEANSLSLQRARLQVVLARQALAGAGAQDPQGSQELDTVLSVYLGTPVTSTPVTVRQSQRQAAIGFAQATAQVAQARQQIRVGVAQAYVQWQKALALREAYQAHLEQARSQLATVEAALAAGTVSPAEVIQVRSQLAAQEAALAAAEAGVAAARSALERAVGVSLPAGIRPTEGLLEALPPLGAQPEGALAPASTQPAETGGAPAQPEATDLDAMERLIAQALAERPDLRQARLEVEARRLDMALLAEQVGAGSEALHSARQQVQEAALALADAAAAATNEVQQAVAALNRAREQYRARSAAADAAAERYRVARLRAEAGAATPLEVQSALAARIQAEADRIQAAADLVLAQTNLAYALGEL